MSAFDVSLIASAFYLMLTTFNLWRGSKIWAGACFASANVWLAASMVM